MATAVKRQSAVKPKSSLVNVIFCIDESGSMGIKRQDVIVGFNTYVKELLKDKQGQYTLSATKFNTETKVLFLKHQLNTVKLDELTYVPGGNTALLDAVGVMLDEVVGQFGPGPYGDEKVLFVIMTDGEENSSRRYNLVDIRGKIGRRTKNGNWTFIYLGADQGAWADKVAFGMGIGAGNTMSYSSGATGQTMTNTAQATLRRAAMRTSSTASFYADAGQTKADYNEKAKTDAQRAAAQSIKTGKNKKK